MVKFNQNLLYVSLVGSVVISISLPSQASPRLGITPSGIAIVPNLPASGITSSSSSSSSYSSSTGSGSTSSATATSPTGTSSSNQTVFNSGATSSSANATAAASINAPNTTRATANAPAATLTNSATPTPTTTFTNSAVVVSLPTNTTPAATFISTFTLPAALQGHENRTNNAGGTTRQAITVQGLPSRVFPGLGLRLVSSSPN